MMIGHHTGAIRMAERAKDNGEHHEIKQLADEIITAQQREIDLLAKHAGRQHG